MLKRRDDIRRILSSKKAYFASMQIRYCANGLAESRFLIIPEKKAHAAVGRNLMRRRISEILRVNQLRIRSGFDIALFAKRDCLRLDHPDLEGLVLKTLEKGGLLMS